MDAPRGGAENMEIDRQLLEYAAEQQTAVLRLYQWSEPTVSLGYFQKYEEYKTAACNEAPGVVRRATGGGAIVHHYDWTYSLAVPDMMGAPSNSGVQESRVRKLGASEPLYDLVHDAIVQWLQGYGWAARKWREDCKNASSPSKCSFLCFERRSRGDVVVGDSKVLGSAQRRVEGATLQHGSLLLSQSPFAPSLLGLAELPSGDLAALGSMDSMMNCLYSAVQRHISGALQVCSLDAVLPMQEWADSKFHAAAWLNRV